MPTLRIALAQVDPTVGDLAGNIALVRGWTRKAAERGAHLVAFPEMMMTGYPVEDLVFRESFVAASRAAVERARRRAGRGRPRRRPSVVVGYLDADGPARDQRRRRRRAAAPATPLARAARRPGRGHATSSTTCPTTASSTRTATSCRATRFTVVRIGGVDVALTICEDIWQAGGPFAVAGAGRRRAGREHQRLAVRAEQGRRAAAAGGRGARPRPSAAVAYVNMVGGQDELVFDGDSMVVAADGDAAGPGAAVRRGAARLDLDLPAAADARRGRPPTARTACGSRAPRVATSCRRPPPRAG